ncbi:unnamed protein product, partial [Ixodes pacificus]
MVTFSFCLGSSSSWSAHPTSLVAMRRVIDLHCCLS